MTPSSSQRARGLGKAVPATQSRAGEGQGIGQRAKGQFICPSQTDCSGPPLPQASSDLLSLSDLGFSFVTDTQLLSLLPAAGFGDPVLGLAHQTPTILLPSFLLRSESGLGNIVPLLFATSIHIGFVPLDIPAPEVTDKQAES